MQALITVAVSVIVSIITSRIIAAYHFKVTDSYVRDLIEFAKLQIKEAYSNQDKH